MMLFAKDEHTQVIKTTADTLSAVFTIGALLDLLPSIAAALSIIWYLTRLWEYAMQKIKQRKGDIDG